MKRPIRLLSYEEVKVRDWLKTHRGILTRIALRFEVSPQFAQAIAYGRSTAKAGHVVEKALRKAGWPGVRKYNA
jgi:hypothetical protein